MSKKKALGRADNGTHDPDSPELTADLIRRMRPMREAYPEFVENIADTRKRGRPKLEHPKVQVTLRLDQDVVDGFREDGPGWQGRINETLKKAIRKRARR
jgi:uncharacterized protein (DUF4415 family)